jgi:streptogramin lyase
MVSRRALVASALILFGVTGCGATSSGLSADTPTAPGCLRSTPWPSPAATASAALDVAKYEVPGPNPGMQHIITGPDGNLWFTGAALNTDIVGRITPTGTITLYHPPTKRTAPFGITAGPDGNLWFTEAGKIGRLVPSTGRIDEFALPRPSSATTPPPTSGASTLYFPGDIVAGPDGNLWFAVQKPAYPPHPTDGFVGRITPAGAITLFAVPKGPISIQVGADGNLWSRLTTSTPCNPSELSSTLVGSPPPVTSPRSRRTVRSSAGMSSAQTATTGG